MAGSASFHLAGPLGGVMGTAALVLFLFGALFLALWWKDRDSGAQWIGASIWMAAFFYGADAFGQVKPPGAHMGPPWATSTLAASLILFTIGLCKFVDPLRWARKPSTYLAIAPMAVLLALMLLQVRVPRSEGNWLWPLPYVVLAAIVWRARAVEPRAGYAFVAASLLLLPLGLTALWVLKLDVVYLRYVSLLSRVLVALTLLGVMLHRRRVRLQEELARRLAAEQGLEEAKATLEQRIAQRTADLQSVVAGLESFNRSVSHDLRGPLGGIAGVAQIAVGAVDRRDLGKARNMLVLIAHQAQRTAELVTALLELARMGHAPLHRSEVALSEVVRTVVDELALDPRTRIPPALHVAPLPVVDADPRMLRIVYTNLLGNAYKFLDGRADGRVEIGVDTQQATPVFFVRDNGPGFDPAGATTMFEPFHRFHSGYAGHGVGLSIVRRAVERHGGRVWAEAQPGRGACFYFTLREPPDPA
jgi:signal transduction histidine kinase